MRYITDERKFPTAMEVCHVYSQLTHNRSERDLVRRTGLEKGLVKTALKSLKLQGKVRLVRKSPAVWGRVHDD